MVVTLLGASSSLLSESGGTFALGRTSEGSSFFGIMGLATSIFSQMSPLYQLFYLDFELSTIICIVTIVTVIITVFIGSISYTRVP